MQKDESLSFLHPLIALEWQLVIQMWDVLDACWQPMLYNVQAQMTHPFPVLFERMHSRLLLLTTLILPIILSGTERSHDTVTVLFQEAHAVPNSKPPVSSDRLSKTTCFIQNKLPCQDVPIHCKPAVSPSLPSGFQVIEDTDLPILKNTIDEACRHERLISLLRISVPDSSPQCLPSWGGVHALITNANVPLMRVGFLPVIPSPVTDYATVRKALMNLQNVCTQLSQTTIPVFCDEGVFHTVADILLSEPEMFTDICCARCIPLYKGLATLYWSLYQW